LDNFAAPFTTMMMKRAAGDWPAACERHRHQTPSWKTQARKDQRKEKNEEPQIRRDHRWLIANWGSSDAASIACLCGLGDKFQPAL
jgi:hypothetical protein